MSFLHDVPSSGRSQLMSRDFLHCWVTDLPWSEDGVAVWEAGSVNFVAGHNLFKQAPALGRALARAATGGGLSADLTPEARLGEPQQ